MKKITAALCGILLLPALPALAQSNLTRAQEGRMAVGQCYSACTTDAESAAIDWMELYWDNWHQSSEMTQQEWSLFTTTWFTLGCLTDQSLMVEAYACRQGCLDMERAYGVGSTSAKTAFNHEYNLLQRLLRPSGLWRNTNRDRPAPNTAAFDRACQRYWDVSTAASVHSMPGRNLPDLLKKSSGPD